MENIFIIKLLLTTGIPGIVIIGLGIVGAAIIFERYNFLYMKNKLSSRDFIERIKLQVLKGEIDNALSYCDSNTNTPSSKVIKEILMRADRDDDSIYQGVDLGLSKVTPQLSKRAGHLFMIANVATLVGLLGTITGLIKAFASLSDDTANKAQLLSEGISMAMNTTAMGLTVAIPVLIFSSILNSRKEQMLDECHEHSTTILDTLREKIYSK